MFAVVVFVAVSADPGNGDILVLRDSQNRIYITNKGSPSGHRVVSRHAETPRARPKQFDGLIERVADRFRIDPALVKAVVRVESNFDPGAVSPKGAMGLMQLMPETARWHSVSDPFDPAQNVKGGVRHLRYLLDRYEYDLDRVLAAYNAGETAVDSAGGVPPYRETQSYVRLVKQFFDRYQ